MALTNPALVLAAVFVAHLIAVLSPGPNVLLVSAIALGGHRRAGVAAALGIATAAAVWSSSALLGLAALAAQAPIVPRIVRWIGAAYLLHLARRSWRSAEQAARAGDPSWRPSAGAAFRAGLLTNLGNPKALVLYLGVIGALVPAHAPVWLEAAVVVLVTLNSAFWNCVLAIALSTGPARSLYRRAGAALDRAAALMLAAIAVLLVVG